MKNTIKNIIEQLAEENIFLLINIITRGSNKSPAFEVYIDNKEGINADICAKFSREIKSEIELTKFAELDYKLIVSSPGIDEPLKFLDQYYKHINREFKLSYDDGEKILSIEAKLLSINEESLVFNYKKEDITIDFIKIKKAKVKLSF